MRARRKPMTWSAKRLFKHASRISGNESINKYSAALFFTPDRIHVYRTMNDVRTSPYMHHDFPFITVTFFLFFFFFFFSRYWSSTTRFSSSLPLWTPFTTITRIELFWNLKWKLILELIILVTRIKVKAERKKLRRIKCIELKFG